MREQRYRLIDVAHRIGRGKSTLVHWEEMGLIPVPARDRFGWRYFTAEQLEEILKRVRETNYFRNTNGKRGKAMRMAFISILITFSTAAVHLFIRK